MTAMRAAWVGLTMGVVTSMACSGRNDTVETQPEGGGPGPGTTVVEGTVALTGSEPNVMVTVRSASGPSTNVTGPLRDELARLSGAVVRVRGTLADGGMRFLTAQHYEILTIDGQHPAVGVLQRRGEEFWLESDQPIRVDGGSADLVELVGATMWVVGPRSGQAIRLHSYGIIRPASPE